MIKKASIALALDAPNLAVMKDWIIKTSPYLQCMKVGLEAFLRDGRDTTKLVKELAKENELFLDLKLHDIPQTVENAVKAIKDIEPDYLTVHAAGGKEMIERAAQALPNGKIVAVTVLTSLNKEDLAPFAVDDLTQLAVELAKNSVEAGARAIVCSPQEVSDIRNAVGGEITLITPGVRPNSETTSDQKRVTSAEEALKNGSDLLVIGRPITQSDDIEKSARDLAAKILSIS